MAALTRLLLVIMLATSSFVQAQKLSTTGSSKANTIVLTIRSTLRGVGEGFADDKDYIVPEQCLNDELVLEL